MAKYFTADPHFSDPFVAVMRGFVRPKWIKDKYQKALELYGLQVAMDEMRDFIEENRIRVKSIADTEAHNKCIVDNINKIVGENDQLWIVGDLAYHLDRKELAYWLDQINAPPENRVLVLGNHDDGEKTSFYKRLFGVVDHRLIVSIKNNIFNVSHYPYRKDMGFVNSFQSLAIEDDFRTPLIFGHTHGTYKVHPNNFRAIHVGLDAWNLYPVHESRVSSLLQASLIKAMKNYGYENFQQKLFHAG